MTWRRAAMAAFVIALLALSGAFLLIEQAKQHFRQPGSFDSAVFFDIPQGAGASQVAADLATRGLIESFYGVPAALFFREGAKQTGQSQSIRYGTFDIPAAASMADILAIITKSDSNRPRFRVQLTASQTGGKISVGQRQPGQTNFREIQNIAAGETIPADYFHLLDHESSIVFWVSIPEGLTSWQIVQSLKWAHFLSGESGETPPEGSLAPNTYEVAKGLGRQTLLRDMQVAQEDILTREWEKKIKDHPLETAYDALILASIIEKETGMDSERGLVASVFVNRIRKSMPLQTDPTVIYGITEGQAPLGRGLRQSELKRDTPYNTYLHKGLPPSPIANPGPQAIRAALNPEDSDYLFFVADGKGGHAFAETYAEHKKNVRVWRQIESHAAQKN